MELQVLAGGVAFVGDIRVMTICPDVPRIQELGPDGLPAVLRCEDGPGALTSSQIVKARAKEEQIQKAHNVGISARCHRQLTVCLQRSVTKDGFAFGNDPRHINVPQGHPWLGTHRSRELMRCAITIFCKLCGASSSGNRTSTLAGLCDPSFASHSGRPSPTDTTTT